MRRTTTLAMTLALIMAGCGSAFPDVVEALPAEVGGFEREERALAGDGRFVDALEAEGIAPDIVTGHEVRWGDQIRMILLRFEKVGLNEPARAAQRLLGIDDAEAAIGILGNQTVITLTGEGIDGVAYSVALSGNGSEMVMATVVAPSDAEAEPIIRAIADTLPPVD